MSDVRLTESEREAILACDCGHDIHEHNYLGCYASDYYPDRQVHCTCTETDDRPAVNFAAVERILATRLADRDAAGVEAVRALADRWDHAASHPGGNFRPTSWTQAADALRAALRAALSGPADAHPADGTSA